MGATKRLAEMLLQAQAAKGPATTISMVRFGNVLGSSGSVVPKFKKQIKEGGPITITHPDITRYFMSIPEAAQLVLQASSLCRGGEVFVLDMGDPIKIVDLARDMIRLSGLTEKSHENDSGDIEIKYTGLRPGEKLFEEMFIGDDYRSTEVRKIFVADENFLPLPVFERNLNKILALAENGHSPELVAEIKLFVRSCDISTDATVPEYTFDKTASEFANEPTGPSIGSQTDIKAPDTPALSETP